MKLVDVRSLSVASQYGRAVRVSDCRRIKKKSVFWEDPNIMHLKDSVIYIY